jgi:ATP-binding cassette subfamily B protein
VTGPRPTSPSPSASEDTPPPGAAGAAPVVGDRPGDPAAETVPIDAHEAAVEVLADSAPPGSHDEPRPVPVASPPETHILQAGAIEVLRQGLRATPELRRGIRATVAMAVATAVGRLAVPVLIQQILDRGLRGPDGFRPAFVYPACAATAVLVAGLYLVTRATYLRMVRASEDSLLGLRVRTFDHIHRLSMAEHGDQRRGALVARVTSDIETLAQFMEWGAVAWVVDTLLIGATITVMAAYDWRLAGLVVLAFLPLAVLFPILQRRQLAAQDRVRTAVGETLSEVSETITGAALIQAYGLEERGRTRLGAAIQRQYKSHMSAARFFALMFPLGDLFGAVALAAVTVAGAGWGTSWGLGVGELVAFLFLVGLLLNPAGELSEILDQTQIALAGWRKVLGVLATPVDVPDPDPGRSLPAGALGVDAAGVTFAYRDGVPVLQDIDVHVPAGKAVAVVGETGSGKTTFAKLLVRLADPGTGAVRVGGVDLRDVAPAERQRAVRLVPQDGFLFDATLADNVRLGAHRASDEEILRAFDQLGLSWWLDELPLGLATPVGERGANLSVGERQLVALARAQLGDPGLLVLDEATSAVDPETEQALARALARLAEGRTMVSIAHRLSTAEGADLVLVFDDGRVVERGSHPDLVAAGGTYARLYESWLGNTSADGAATP